MRRAARAGRPFAAARTDTPPAPVASPGPLRPLLQTRPLTFVADTARAGLVVGAGPGNAVTRLWALRIGAAIVSSHAHHAVVV